MIDYQRLMKEDAATVAVVEDDAEIRDLVTARLMADGFSVLSCGNAAALDAALKVEAVDIIVLDLMMPGEDGLSVCRRLSTSGGPPIIILSAKGDDIDRIVGLEIGADDYIAKPFNPRELTARIRSVLRRRQQAEPHPSIEAQNREVYRFLGWRLDIDDRTLINSEGLSVVLSPGEFSLLTAFARHPRRVLSRDQLLDWTRGDSSAPVDRAIDVQLSRLRKKLGDDPRDPLLIKTVRGDGYLFAASVQREGDA